MRDSIFCLGLDGKEYCLFKNIPLMVIDYKKKITEDIVIRKEYLC